ncbi:NF-kappa-B essential modulator [Octopus bimaculoides]|uniref:C2H2-type domain-containing protein n=1 Tax=Octopus bimaculoides TaxID=37653 RepID=A0A0L8G942_OCTBM|nr:NF-kappa-B essential modulator [Octopus bimaculoides]|eukprot:XP_014783120.1 PREDICTED: NF-kappa-B essential modulator-like [Octopus bimaculoides]
MESSSSLTDFESSEISFDELSLDKAILVIKQQRNDINNLRDTLATNNAKMKQHWDRIKEWKENVINASAHNKTCFEESQKTIQELQMRNTELTNELKRERSSQVHEDNKETLSTNENHESFCLPSEIESLRNQSLLEKERNTSAMCENLQAENNKLTEENLNSYQKYQTLLVQTKQESSSEDLTDLSSKLENYGSNTDETFSNLINDNSQLGNYSDDAFYKSMMNQLSIERLLVNDLRMQNNELEKKIKTMQDTLDSKLEQERVKYLENIQNIQKKHNEEIERLQLTIPDLNIVKSMAVDQEALKRQVMILLDEARENKEETASLREIQAIKTEQCQRLDEANVRLRMEMKTRQEQDTQLINTLQYCIQDFDKKLIAEREHVNIKQEQNKRLREAFQQLLEDYKGLLELNSQLQPMVEEKKELQEQIDFLTAKTYATEESYQVQEDKYNKIRSEKEELLAENELLKTQAEVFKADFDAEREGSTSQKRDIEKLKQTMKHLELANKRLGAENQDLLSRIERHTEQQLSEMRQRCSTSLKPTSKWKHNNEYASTSGMEAMQHEYVEQYQCPQCNHVFPDADSLNLHFEEHK